MHLDDDSSIFQFVMMVTNSNITSNNSTVDAPLKFNLNGGITFTLVLNIIICTILFLLFLCLHPCLPLYNVSKKRKLLDKAHVYEEQMKKENLTSSEKIIITTTEEEHQLTNNDDDEDEEEEEGMHEIDLNDDKSSHKNKISIPSETNTTTIDANTTNRDNNNINTNEPNHSASDMSHFKNLLNLSDEDPNVQLPIPNLINENKILSPGIRTLKRTLVIMNELGLYVWRVLLSFFSRRHNNEDMRELCKHYSRDVAVYLLFQKQIIFALSLCTFLGLVILFPLHLTGKEPRYEYQFEYQNYNLTREDYPLLRTSISMVIEAPAKLAAHVILGIVFVLIFSIFLHRFRTSEVVTREHFLEEQLYLQQEGSSTRFKTTKLVSKYSVQIKYLPPDFASPTSFDRMIREELCPDLRVYKTVLMFTVYERIELQNIHQQLKDELERYIYLHKYKKKSPITWFCSFKYGIRSGINAIDYYRDKMLEVEEKIKIWDDAYIKVMNDQFDDTSSIKPTGNGFVIFETPQDAMECLGRYYQLGTISKPLRPTATPATPSTPVTDVPVDKEVMKHVTFNVASAYEPEDINWDKYVLTVYLVTY
jgi:hypothetical protein